MEQIYLYLGMVKRSWWIVVLCTLAALTASLLLLIRETPMYRTSSTFLVTPNLALDRRDTISTLNPLDNDSLTGTYAEILQSNIIFQQAGASLGLSPEVLEQYEQRAVVLPQATVLELFIDGPDPEIAAALANAIGQHAIEYIEGLYQVFKINLLDQAEAPPAPFSPAPKRSAGVALMFGFIAGAGLAFAREQVLLFLQAQEQKDVPGGVRAPAPLGRLGQTAPAGK